MAVTSRPSRSSNDVSLGPSSICRSSAHPPQLLETPPRDYFNSFIPPCNSLTSTFPSMEKAPLLSGSQSHQNSWKKTPTIRNHSRVRWIGGAWLVLCFVFIAFAFREELNASRLLNYPEEREKSFGWDDVSAKNFLSAPLFCFTSFSLGPSLVCGPCSKKLWT